MDTVPTDAEALGDFSASGATVFDPNTSHPNPNYNPALPVSTSNPQTLRTAFANNLIPVGRLNPAAALMLKSYVPRPNSMGDMGYGMTMNGTPTVFGAGMDSNNLLDVRNSLERNNQGTLRIDRTFSDRDTLSARFSSSNEQGFMPQNLPGYGFNFDNASQNGSIIWTRIITPSIVNTASVGVSRLAMHHWTENNGKNDIVDILGITGTNFGGPAAWGAPYFNVQGYSPFGDAWQATPMSQWSTTFEGRETLGWQKGRHSMKFGGDYRRVIWPMWALVQSRGFYQFTPGFTTQTSTNDGTGSGLASFLLGDPASRQLQAGVPSMNLRSWSADAFAQDTWRITSSTTLDFGVRYEFETPLVDIQRSWSNIEQQGGQLVAFIGGQNGMPQRPSISSQAAVRSASGRRAPLPADRRRFPRRIRHLLHACGYEYLVQPVAQRAHSVPHHSAERQLHSADQWIQFPGARVGQDRGGLHGLRPACACPVCSAVERLAREEPGHDTTLEVGYHGARGLHLQQAHLINNALPGPARFRHAGRMPPRLSWRARPSQARSALRAAHSPSVP